MTKLRAKLPPWEVNGLAAIREQLLADPQAQHVAIVVIDVCRITNDVVDRELIPTPTIRILRIEPETDPDRAAVLLAHARDLTDARIPPPQPQLPGLGDLHTAVPLHAVRNDDHAL